MSMELASPSESFWPSDSPATSPASARPSSTSRSPESSPREAHISAAADEDSPPHNRT